MLAKIFQMNDIIWLEGYRKRERGPSTELEMFFI